MLVDSKKYDVMCKELCSMLCLVFGSLLFGSRVKKEDYHLGLIEYDYIPLGPVASKAWHSHLIIIHIPYLS